MKNSKTEGMLKGALSLTLASLLVKIVGVFYKIPLSHILGDEGMGFFNTAYTVYTFFFLLSTAGVPKAITILITKEKDRKDEDSLLHSATVFFFAIGLALSVTLALLSAPIAAFIGNRKAVYSMLAIAPSIVFITVASVYRGYLNGKMRFGSVAISQCIEAAVKLGAGLLLARIAVSQELPLEIISAYTVLGISLSSVLTCVQLYIELKIAKKNDNTEQNKRLSLHHIKDICRISLPITASSGVMSLVNVIDLALVMRGLASVGYSEQISGILYGNYTTLAVPMFNFALSVVSAICTSALPLINSLYSVNDLSKAREKTRDAALLSAFVSAPATAVFSLYSAECLSLLFDDGSVALGACLLSALAPSILLISILTVINTALEGTGSVYAPLISMSFGCAAKIFSSYLLVGIPELAIYGAPIGTAMSYITSLLISFILMKKTTRVRAVDLMAPFFVPIVNSATSALCVAAIESQLELHLTQHSIVPWRLVVFAASYVALTFLSGVFKKIKAISMSK